MFNADLVDDVARRRFVLFVGAGASKWASPAGGGTFKDWVQFLKAAEAKLADRRLRKIVAGLIKDREYLLASEILKSALDGEWTTLLTREFQQAADVSRLHASLISLEPRIVITTNFDKLIENAWAASPSSHYPTVLSKIDAGAFRIFRNDERYLIKLHGSIDQPSEITFDKTSYQRDAYSNRYYSELLTTLLLTHTFIFVGFSMTDPAVASIVESAAYRFPDTRPHYIFQSGRAVPEVDTLARQFRKLYVLRYDEASHHKALADKLDQLATAATSRRAEISAARAARV